MGWSSGPPRMVEGEAELEEGEAAFDDDKSIDLERDLSYLDEKVQSVLGHFQKDFEGGVSAENLGAKFGGYGSFLPTYQRSPSIWSQPKSPQRVQTHSSTRSPNYLHMEGTVQNATAVPDAPSSQRNGNAVTSSGKMSQEMMVPLGDGSVRQDSLLASAQVPDKFPKRHQQATNRPLIPNNQKSLKFRIKVGSDKTTQKNAALYSGLGLTSPSSSTGNSLGESEGNLRGSRETPNGSLSSILQMLTSVIVAGGLLLSPLHDKFLNFTSNFPKESKPGGKVKFKRSQSAASADDSTSQLRDEDALTRKHTQDRKSGRHKESKDGDGKAFEDDMQSRLKESSGAQMLQNKQCMSFDVTEKRPSKSITNMGESSRDSAKAVGTSREYDNGSVSSKREFSKATMKGRFLRNELVKDESLESMSAQSSGKFERREAKSSSLQLGKKKQTLSSQKDVPVDHHEGTRSNANTNPATSEGERDFKGDVNHFTQKLNMKATSTDHDELRTPDTAKKFSSESKRKSKGAQVKGKVSLDSAQERGRTGVPASANEKGTKSNVLKVSGSHKNLLETNSERRSKAVDILEDRFGDGPRESNFDTLKEKNAHDRLKEKPSSKKFDNQATSGIVLKDPPSGSLPSNIGATLGGEQPTVAPFVIEENWVCCDSCQKWRLLPYGTKPEHLPEKWLCRMLDWLPGMNRCDISEEETTKALQALNQLPLPENQSGSQIHAYKSTIGAHPIDQHLVNQKNQNFNFDYLDNGRKKTYKAKEISVPASKTKSSQQDMMKMGSSKDRKQLSVGSNLSNKLSSQRPTKPGIAVKEISDRQTQERVTGGDAKPKIKVKRESDQDDHEIRKRIKTEGAFDINNFQTSTPNHDRLGSSLNSISTTMASVKNNQNKSENDYSKDLKVDERNGLQTSVRKSRENASGLLDSESSDVVRKSNDKEIPSKKRKVKDWQHYSDTPRVDGSHLRNRDVPVKEESSDSGFMREKKLRVSQSGGKESGSSKSTADLRRKEMKTTMLPSASKNIIDGNFDNPKQQNKYRMKITMEDLESLKKDLAVDPVSTAATSSSSKVSDSRKTRSSYQEMKGSPVESVSSSPMRMSNMNKLSLENDVSEFDDAKVGDFSTNRSPREVMAGDVNHVSKRPVMAKKRRSSDLLKPECTDNPSLDLLETDAGDKFRGESKVGVKPSTLNRSCLDNNLHLWEGDSPCCTGIHASEPSKERIGKNQHNSHQRSWKASSFPKDKDGSCALNSGAALEMASDSPNEVGVLNSKRSSRVEIQTAQSHDTACGVSNNDAKQTYFDQSGIKSAKANKNVIKRESRKLLDDCREDHMKPGEKKRSSLKLDDSCNKDGSGLLQNGLVNDFGAQAAKNILTQEDCRNGKSMVDRHSGDEHEALPSARKLVSGTLNGNLLHVRAHDVSTCNDVPKLSKGPSHAITENEPRQIMGNCAPDRSVLRDSNGPSLLRKDASGQTIPSVLKEAESLRAYADQIKGSGFGFECNETYFQAALKFLHGASLLENNTENNKSGDLNQLQIYISTAKIFETCAHEYERQQEMAVAALSYKCMEVTYMRMIYCKSSSANRHWHDLQASLQNAPQGESPSSSASDIDNLNNQAVVEKAPLSKSNGSHSGSHIIAPRNRPNFVRLLDYTKDVNSAMEASKKAQTAFAAANLILEEAQNKEGVVAVKRVIDFSFQDVEEFVRLIRMAVESISRQHGIGGSRD